MKKIILSSTAVIALSLTGYFQLTNTSISPTYEERTHLTSSSKAQSWRVAQEYQKMFRADVSTGEINPQDVLAAREQVARMQAKRSTIGLEWEERGPDNVGGRTRAILVDIRDTTGNTVYAGSVSGGLWKSTNGCVTWNPLDDHSATPAISCIAQGSGGTIYVGTGCTFENFGDLPDGNGSSGMTGMGMLKSTDGVNFSVLSSTVPQTNTTADTWSAINAIAVDPTNDNRLFAATKNGLMLSEDGGGSWEIAAFNNVAGNLIAIAKCQDVDVADDGTVLLVAQANVYVSSDGSVDSFVLATAIDVDKPNGTRTVVKYAPSDNNIVWAISVLNTSPPGSISQYNLEGLYRSLDKGYTWDLVQGPVTNLWDENSGLFNGQGYYDLALGIHPTDPNTVYVGGVQLWRYDGSLTRIAAEFGSGQYIVHSDKHDIVFDPHNPNKMLVVSDGGVHVSYDQGQTYFPASKGYNTVQFYAIGFDNDGERVGGSQDNGTYLLGSTVDDDSFSTGLEGLSINGGDGFYCDFSQLNDLIFVTSQNGVFYRGQDNALGAATMCTSQSPGPVCDAGGFYSVSRLWESANDPTSRDSVLFSTVIPRISMGQGDGDGKNFSINVYNALDIQDAAILVDGSFKVYAGSQELLDSGGLFSGNGSGTVAYSGNNKGEVEVVFDVAPTSTETVWLEFSTRYDAGDQLNIQSRVNEGVNTQGEIQYIRIPYVLPMNLSPGDELKIQDPVQSLFAAGKPGAVSFTRKALDLEVSSDQLDWIDIPISGYVSHIEFTEDGNHAFVGTGYGQGSVVYRISGLNDLYTATDINNVTVTSLGSLGGSVTGIAIDPNDPNNVVATSGNYGQQSFVWRCQNALTASGSSSFTSIQGDLPLMPCFGAVIMPERPGICVIGTDMGVWAADLNVSPIQWSNESGSMSNVPVHDVRQQTLGYGPSNHTRGQIYLGTHGRGMWESTAGTGIGEFGDVDFTGGADFVSNLTVYPNPMSTNGAVRFNLQENSNATIQIFDMTGKLVQSISRNSYNQGSNTVDFTTDQMGQGTYFITVETAKDRKVAKFVVM